VETQRQWSDKAIARSTPLLPALFSIVTLMASRLTPRNRLRIQQTAWYQKLTRRSPIALAVVRKHLRSNPDFFMSLSKCDQRQIPGPTLGALFRALCYAARLGKLELSLGTCEFC